MVWVSAIRWFALWVMNFNVMFWVIGLWLCIGLFGGGFVSLAIGFDEVVSL